MSVLGPDVLEMLQEAGLDDAWEHGDPVLVALAAPDHNLVRGKVDVLYTKPTTFQYPEAGTVQQGGHEARDTVKPLEQRADLIPAEDDRKPLRAPRAHDAIEPREIHLQHVLVEEQEGAQRLILRRGGDLPIDRQGREELRNLDCAHLSGMPFVVEEDEAPDPGDVRLLGAAAHMPSPQGLTDAIQEARFRGRRKAVCSNRRRREPFDAGRQHRILAWRACLSDGHVPVSGHL